MKNDPRYRSLLRILLEAYAHATVGKGEERHGTKEPLEEQHMVRGAKIFGIGGPLYQAHKKIEEAMRLTGDARKKECLGAMIYIAGAIRADELTHEERGDL